MNMNNQQFPQKTSIKIHYFDIIILSVIISIGFWVSQLSFLVVHAQEEAGLVLKLSRDFGYSSGTGKIQGTFSMKITSSMNLEKVVFYIDDMAIGEDNTPPFQYQFNTDNFSLSKHTIHAEGYSADGRAIQSNVITVQFVSPDEGWQAAIKITIPIIGLVLLAILISFALPLIFRRGKPKQIILPKKMGGLGGTICPKCGLPFSIPFFKINLLFGSLLPCPYCGKWVIIHPVNKADFEVALLNAKSQQKSESSIHQSEEDLQKEIDDSRYLDL